MCTFVDSASAAIPVSYCDNIVRVSFKFKLIDSFICSRVLYIRGSVVGSGSVFEANLIDLFLTIFVLKSIMNDDPKAKQFLLKKLAQNLFRPDLYPYDPNPGKNITNPQHSYKGKFSVFVKLIFIFLTKENISGFLISGI
jgi:hypothetical protein